MLLAADRLDDPAYGDLHVEAALERGEEAGLIYALAVRTAAGEPLVSGRAVIVLPRIAPGHPA